MAKFHLRIASILNAISKSRFRRRLADFVTVFWRRGRSRDALKQALRAELAAGPIMRFRRLEPRRVLNASFVFNGVDALLLSNFDDVGGTTAVGDDSPGPRCGR